MTMNAFVFLQLNSTILIRRNINLHAYINQCCGLNVFLQNPSAEALTTNMTVWRRAFKAVIKVLRGHKGGAPTDRTRA